MKNRKNARRLWALLLAVMMVFQQTNIVTFAEEEVPVVAEPTPTMEAALEVPTPEPEIEEPITQEPTATPVPQEPTTEPTPEPTEEPEPEETPAPQEPTQEPSESEPTPEPTETPVSQEPTETPAAEPTDVPEETVTPTPEVTVTPIPTETPKTEFTCQSGNVVVYAIATESANLPQDAKLHADYMNPGSAAYEAAVAAMREASGSEILDCILYDIYFTSEKTGGRIEPENGTVTVTLQFASPVLDVPENAEVDGYQVLHVDDNGSVENVTNGVTTTGDGSVSSVGFISDSFSPFGVVLKGQINKIAPFSAGEGALVDYVDSISTSVTTLNDSPISGEYDVDQGFKVVLRYALNEVKKDELINGVTASTVTLSYPMPPEIISKDPSGTGGITDQNNQNMGIYRIEGNMVYFDIYTAFLRDHQNISGTFTYDFYADESKIDDEDKIQFEFPGSTDPVSISIKKPSVSTSKTYTVDADGNLVFTITVKGGKRDAKGVMILDQPGTNLEIDYTSVKLDGTSVTVTPNQKDGSFEISGFDVPKNTERTITYTAKIKEPTLDVDNNGIIDGLNNISSWKLSSSGNWEPSGDTWPSVKKASYGHKSGTASNDQGKITWTVRLNDGTLKHDVSGKKYVDTLTKGSENQKYDQESLKIIQILPDGTKQDVTSTLTVNWNEDGKSFDFTLPDDAGKAEYEVTYTTSLKEELQARETVTVTNKGTFDGEDIGGGSGTLTNSGEMTITKKAVGDFDQNNLTQQWETVITPPQPEGWTNGFDFYDVLANVSQIPNDGVPDGDYIGFVFDEDRFSITGEDINKDGNGYAATFSQTTSAQGKGAVGNDYVSIHFTGTYTKPITITYTTKADESSNFKNGEGNNLYNTSLADGKYANARVWYYINVASDIFKKGTVNYDEKLGAYVINWEIVANVAGQYDNTVLRDLGGNNITIVEQLPEGLEYIEGTAQVKKWAEGERWSSQWNPIEPTQNGTALNFEIANVKKEAIELTFRTKVKELNKAYNNIVSWESGETTFGSTETKVDVLYELLKKDGKVLEVPDDPTIQKNTLLTYEIDVNKDGKNYLQDSDVLTLKDTIPENINLVNGSVSITDASGTPVAGARYLYDSYTRVLTISVPDGMHVIVRYRATPVLDGLTPGDDGTYSIEVSNTVSLEGQESVKSTADQWYKVEKSKATIEGSKDTLTLHKIDAQDTSKDLEGAAFQLVAVTFEQDGQPTETVQSTQTSNENGIVTFSSIAFDKIYYYQETDAPDGYIMNSSKYYFIYHKDGENEEEYQKAISYFDIAHPGEALHTSGGGKAEDVTNFISGSAVISASKTIEGANIEDYTFDFKLTEMQKDGDDHYTPKAGGVQYTAHNDQDGKIEFPEITYEAEGEYYYQIEEIEKSGYSNVTFDTNKYMVTVNVSKNALTGSLAASVTYPLEEGIIFKNTLEKMEISGSKIWKDNNNQDGKRPESITINLLANGTQIDSKTVTNEDGWKWSFTDLPKYKNGREIVYTITEDKVEGYTPSVVGYDVTNSHTPEETSKTVVKAWDDNNNQDGIRPNSITVQLLADGKAYGEAVTLNAGNNWTYTWNKLPKKANGTDIVYTVKEIGILKGYTTAYSEDTFTITNSHTPETVSVSGSKTWNDNSNQYGKRPASITINLWGNGEKKADKTVTNEDGWKWNFTDLPKYENGAEIKYSITEDPVAEYATSVSGYNVTNSYTPGETSKTVVKAWDDNNNQDGIRPDSITVQLFANGEAYGGTVALSAGNNWTHTWNKLPEKANGTDIVYTVKEASKLEGYTPTYSGDTITNSHIPAKTSKTVKKIWDDKDNQDGKRPTSVVVQLMSDNEAYGETVTLNDGNNWTYTWSDLPKKANGTDIVYTVKEIGKLEGYTTAYSEDTFTITNSHTPETTSVSGSKTWNDNNNQAGKRPASITIHLLANGTQKARKTVTNADGWSWSFTDLPKYENGAEIEYTITEDPVAEYETSVSGYDVTNSYTPGKTSRTVVKAWDDHNNQDGKRPESITVQLLADGEAYGEAVTLNAANKWTYTWNKLPEKANGKDIDYTVEEISIPKGYTPTYSAETFTITNKHETEITEVSVVKTWSDSDDAAGKRPESIEVTLFADGKKVESVNITGDKDGTWAYTFEELPKYEAGQEIRYTIQETPVEGYLTTVNGFDITNTITSVKVSKVDITTAEELEGAKIQILDKDKNVVEEWVSGKEPHEIFGLQPGETYTLREVVAPVGYDITTDTAFKLDEEGNVESITTPIREEDGVLLVEDAKTLISISGVKIWDDADNQDGKRPESITVNLYAGEEIVATQEVKPDEENAWAFRFENLPKYENGQLITYTVKENPVKDYSTTYPENNEGTEIIIKNTYTPEETSKTVTKVWEDADNANGARPDAIAVQLLADGEKYEDEVTLNAENEWTYTWEHLPAMNSGKEVVYSVEEISRPDGYVTAYSEDTFTISNKAISFNVNKVDLNDNEKEVAGAELTVYDKETGEKLDFWISEEGSTHDFGPSLKPGGSYILEETVAPDGYKYTTDIEFHVGEDGSITTDAKTTTDENGNTVYLVEDAPVEAEISKVDATTGEALEGATLRVTDKDGNVIDEWVSDGEGSHLITAKLKLGETYVLTEAEAPENYEIAEPISFTVSEDGEIDPVVMEDARIKSENASITVAKSLTVDGEPLSAVDQTFYVGLYLDEACTQRVGDIKPIVFRNASSSTAVFTNLDIGRTYYVGECDADGTVIEVGMVESGETFFANFAEGNEAVVEEEDGSVTVYFENEFMSIPDGFYIGGKLEVTKRVIDAEGKALESDETFYAGVFDDADYTVPSEHVEYNLLPLEMNGGSIATAETFVDIPEVGGETVLYVTEVDENGVPVEGKEGFKYTVSQDYTTVSVDRENTLAAVEITNKQIEEKKPTAAPTPTPSTTTTKPGVKTGDNSPIGLYLALLAASMVLIGTTGYRRRRRNGK